jgi:hypothetical protein
VLGAVFYTVMPMLFVVFTVLLKLQFRRSGIVVGTQADSFGSLGFSAITNWELVLWGGLGLSFMVLVVVAWRGRPTWGRFAYVGAVVVYPLLYLALAAFRLNVNQRAAEASGAIVMQPVTLTSLCGVGLITPVLATLYVVWYMNRGPARAFYRGVYKSVDGEPI